MRQQSDHHQFATISVLVVCFCAMGMAGCAWEEIKEKGYESMREHQIRRCQEDPTRQIADCVTQQSYDSYERERSALTRALSRVP